MTVRHGNSFICLQLSTTVVVQHFDNMFMQACDNILMHACAFPHTLT